MKKIPSLFKRDFANNPRLVTREYNDGVEWVLNGEGVPFRKWDGTAVMIKDGILYKRFDAKHGKPAPANGIPCQEPDPETGHWPHWVPVDFGDKANRWILEGYRNCIEYGITLIDGTYEAIGPKINGSKDGICCHILQMHRRCLYDSVPTDYDGLSIYLGSHKIEGIVWHHYSGDGRMVKIKRSDFGLPW